MTTTVSTPVMAWVANIIAGTATAQSTQLTATLNITQAWGAHIPCAVQFSNVSADPLIDVYRSMDGGANYDTQPFATFPITLVTKAKAQGSVYLPTGQYALRFTNSGPNTATWMVPTYDVITAIQNV